MNSDKQHALDQLATLIGALVDNRQELLGDLQEALDAPRSTLESRLSNLENAKRAGATYFFHQDAKRGEVLLRLLKTDDSQRSAIYALVEAISVGPQPVQLVVDVTDWSFEESSRARLWNALEQNILRPGPKPAVLVLTAAQHADLPRLFDDLVRPVRVPGPSAAKKAVESHAREGALVVARRRFDPWTRWVAVDPSPLGSFRIEPSLEKAVTLADATITPPAYLDELGIKPASTTPEGPQDPVALRRALAELEGGGCGDDAPAEPRHGLTDAPARLALSRVLGVRAAATRQECIDFERTGLGDILGEVPQTGTRGDLDALLERAQRRPIEGAALLVDDELHLVNFATKVADRQFIRVVAHEVPCVAPALARLREATADYTEVDWLDDPCMSATLQQLRETGSNRRELLHARATLHYAGVIEPQPLTRRTGADWRGALLRLLERPSAPTALRARLDLTYADPSPRRGDRPLRGLYFLGLEHDDAPALDVALEVPPTGDLVLTREGQAPVLVARTPPVKLPEEDYWESLPAIVLSVDPAAAVDVERWRDLVEASTGLLPDGARRRGVSLENKTPDLRGLPVQPEKVAQHRSTYAVAIPEPLWSRADRLLEISSWTLRDAVATNLPRALHDGTWLIPIDGTGFFAELDIFELGNAIEDAPPMLDAVLRPCISAAGSHVGVAPSDWRLTHLVPYLEAETYLDNAGNTRVGGWLPLGLTFRGEGLYVRVRYGGSPLLASRATHRAGATSALASTTARRTEDEDDDD